MSVSAVPEIRTPIKHSISDHATTTIKSGECSRIPLHGTLPPRGNFLRCICELAEIRGRRLSVALLTLVPLQAACAISFVVCNVFPFPLSAADCALPVRGFPWRRRRRFGMIVFLADGIDSLAIQANYSTGRSVCRLHCGYSVAAEDHVLSTWGILSRPSG